MKAVAATLPSIMELVAHRRCVNQVADIARHY